MTSENDYYIKSLTTPAAEGGTVTTSGNYRIHTFTSSGTFTANKSMNAEILIVGGGGGGGGDVGAGGGGGRVNHITFIGITTQEYNIVIGNGGTALNNGQSSSFGSYSAGGGGYGYDAAPGGGSSKTIDGVTTNYTGGSSSGHNAYPYRVCGGGAGAGANGYAYSGTISGNGGAGYLSSISGSPVYYGGGGGGGVEQCGWTRGTGIHGGGNGGYCCTDLTGRPGTPNTGGGSGGAGGLANVCSALGNTGGSGIVIICYLSSEDVTATSMTITPRETPCRTGVCTIDVSVTWTNNNTTLTSSFTPAITASRGTVSTQSSQSLAAGASVTLPFTVSSITVGTCTICPNPN